MIKTTRTGEMRDGLVVPYFSDDQWTPPGTREIAVHFEWHPEYLPSGFEGPPALTRRYQIECVHAEGMVVLAFTRNERVMSDVWDDVHYVTVAMPGGGFRDYSATRETTVDASEELKAWHQAWCALEQEWARRSEARRYARDRREEARKATRVPSKGKQVVVARGRKVPVGTKGEVIWHGTPRNSRFGGVRVGIKDAQGTVHWTDAGNVDVIGAQPAHQYVWVNQVYQDRLAELAAPAKAA